MPSTRTFFPCFFLSDGSSEASVASVILVECEVNNLLVFQLTLAVIPISTIQILQNAIRCCPRIIDAVRIDFNGCIQCTTGFLEVKLAIIVAVGVRD